MPKLDCRRISTITISIILALALVAVASAQTGNTVSGTVADANGAVVPGATVRLANAAKGVSRTTTTNTDGVFTFTGVAPDQYQIEIEAKGFKKVILNGVAVLVDKPTDIKATVEAGNVSEVVNVTGEELASIVNTSDASLGNNFVSRQISQLPLEGRNVVDLLSLQPGVTPDGAVAGGRQDQANITLDGVDVNDQQTGLDLSATQAFTAVLRVTPDSIEEFRVTTTNPDATKGRSAGAQIGLITKSGTNEFHGNLFEYHRNTLTTANDWFNNASNTPRPKLIRNLYGGSIGGPIIKNRMFFFYNYEGMREAKDVGVTTVVPLPSIGQGSLRFQDSSGVIRTLTTAQINGLTSNGLAVVDVNPVTQAIFAGAAGRYTSNISGGDGFNSGGFRFNAPLPVKQNTHTARFDWNVTKNLAHQISVRMNYQQDVFGGASAFPDTPPTNRWSHPEGLAISHTWVVKSSLTNRFSYGLTRLAYSNQGDSNTNAVTFRDIYTPLNFARTFSRVNPTNNFVDDLTWVRGNHTWQFGTNIRIIRNKRTSLTSAFDNGTTNFGFYPGSGSSLLTPINQYLAANFGTSVASGSIRAAESGLAALLGRMNQYTANFIFDHSGTPVNGAPTVRNWATEEYDWYAQDSWKLRSNMTLNLGLRYSLSSPVYETNGFQAAPNIPLDVYFQRRQQAAFNGQNYDEPLKVDLAGPANHKPGFYNWDKNNFQPRVSFAWSPNFKGGFMGKLFGENQKGVLRGGFAITNDHFGEQLAVQFDAANTLGFVSRYTTPANTYNITTNPAPLITGLGMTIRNLPGVVTPGNLTFPLQQPADTRRRIESSLDRGVVTPVNYSWNFTYGRELPKKMYIEASYIGRLARHLLATRDVMMPNNLRDPKSGVDWYSAATTLEIFRRSRYDAATDSVNTNPVGVPNLAYFDNLWAPGSLAATLAGFGCADPNLTNTQAVFQASYFCVGNNDWTSMQDLLDFASPKPMFYQSQYGALDSFGTVANSNYHAGTLSIRQRLSNLTWDFNYTYGKSLDDTSGLQTAGAFGGAFILNPLRQHDNYGPSDFDMRHIINFNSLWSLPFGKNQHWGNHWGSVANGFIGGWQLATIFRFNSGEPIGTVNKYFDNAGWATNWNLKSAVVQIAPVQTGVFFVGSDKIPNMFADPTAAYKSFRSPFPGESGDRNKLRFPAFWTLDMGVHKTFGLPWSEREHLTFRWEVFNVTNTPIFTGIDDTSLGYVPGTGSPTSQFADYTGTKSNARVMQFALRFEF